MSFMADIFAGHFVWITLAFLIGSCIGSFINLITERYIQNETFFFPYRSYCDYCRETLSTISLIPILNYFIYKGNSKCCHKKINPRYPLIEFLSATISSLVTYKFLNHSFEQQEALYYAFTIFILIAIITIDFTYFIIPDRYNYLLLFISAVYFITSFHTVEDLFYLMKVSTGSVLGIGFMGFIGILLFQKDALGYGDIKLIRSLSVVMFVHELLSGEALLFSLLIIINLANFFGIILAIIKRVRFNKPIDREGRGETSHHIANIEKFVLKDRCIHFIQDLFCFVFYVDLWLYLKDFIFQPNSEEYAQPHLSIDQSENSHHIPYGACLGSATIFYILYQTEIAMFIFRN